MHSIVEASISYLLYIFHTRATTVHTHIQNNQQWMVDANIIEMVIVFTEKELCKF